MNGLRLNSELRENISLRETKREGFSEMKGIHSMSLILCGISLEFLYLLLRSQFDEIINFLHLFGWFFDLRECLELVRSCKFIDFEDENQKILQN